MPVTPNTRDYLIPGQEYLELTPGFKLIKRQAELDSLSGILMRQSAQNVLLVGSGGVGCSALCLGLQASKAAEDASLDIVGKRLYWLDTDGLFASGDPVRINESFQRMIQRLARSKQRDTVLIIEDARVFIDSARNSGNPYLINRLMREVKLGHFQAILETRDSDLEIVLKAHPDIDETFTMMDVAEPVPSELLEIVAEVAKGLSKHHGIKLDAEVVPAAVDLTTKYRVSDMSLSRAQPDRALNLIDRAFVAYRQQAHVEPPALTALRQQVLAAQAQGHPSESTAQALEQGLEAWKAQHAQLREFADKQRKGETLLAELNEELTVQIEAEAARDAQPIDPEEAPNSPQFAGLSSRIKQAGFGSREVARIRERIIEAESIVAENRKAFAALTAEINEPLSLSSGSVLREFSKLSGIPADKLNQDERAKLLDLGDALKGRVFGQDHAMDSLADAVRVARAGLKEPNKPQTAFLYAGPSGVGKTETAKALTVALMDDERALLRFDMSEYMEKHAVAKLIGAPPGYEGYEAGGILTNSMRRNPHVNVLFDEIEKAHPDVFNVLLQVLDDGRLTDNRGLTVSFSEANIIMTTNIGQPYFLDPNLSFDDAVTETLRELDEVYRPEFLNRFNGRQNIVCFKRLGLPVIELIARREIKKINERISAQGSGLSISLTDKTITELCRDKYEPARGARAIPGFFSAAIYPAVARELLSNEVSSGIMVVHYDPQDGSIRVDAPKAESAA